MLPSNRLDTLIAKWRKALRFKSQTVRFSGKVKSQNYFLFYTKKKFIDFDLFIGFSYNRLEGESKSSPTYNDSSCSLSGLQKEFDKNHKS